jgi:hypothetical protein
MLRLELGKVHSGGYFLDLGQVEEITAAICSGLRSDKLSPL